MLRIVVMCNYVLFSDDAKSTGVMKIYAI